jgi:Uma2 family endonuclease
MSALPDSYYTLEEYLALERASDRKFEFHDGQIVCMSGGTIQHATIAENVRSALRERLRGKGCRAFGSDLAVLVPAGRPYRYADAGVACGEVRYQTIDVRHALENPVLLVEVLSKSSAAYDRGAKFAEYKSIPSFAEYLLVDQYRARVTHRFRLDDGTWFEETYTDLGAIVALRTLGIELPLREVYEDVQFQAPEASLSEEPESE